MKKLSKLWLAFLLIGAVFAMNSCSKDDPIVDPPEEEEKVEFASASLANFIREELNIAANVPITPDDLKALTSLTIRGELTDVTSLEGLQYATELTVLDFGGNPGISDLTPIKDLKKITYLRMNETGVTDLSPLSEYTTLTYFNANQASPGISDLSPLSKNVNMSQMILRSQPIGNDGLNGIANFTKLYRLNIRNTGVTDLSVIADLMSKGAFLKTTPGADELGSDPTLDLQQLSITNCEVLAPYRDNLAGEIDGACSVPDQGEEPGDSEDDDNVEVPFTSNQNVANVIRTALQKASGTAITRGDLRSLTRLDLRDIEGDLTSLEGLEYTKNITYFNANGNTIGAGRSKLTSLAPLANNAGMQEIIVRGQPLTDEGSKVLENFTKLYRLNLRETTIGNATIVVLGTLMGQGALLKSTPGAAEAGGDAEVDLRGTSATDFSPIQSYIDAGTAVTVNK